MPCAVCTVCGAVSTNPTAINQTHHCPGRSARKRGIWRSAITVGEWKECDQCAGTGSQPANRCEACQGFGWVNVRR